MKKLLLGGSPLTSIVGYLLAGLMAFQQYYSADATWQTWLIPVMLAVLGRVAGDAKKEEV